MDRRPPFLWLLGPWLLAAAALAGEPADPARAFLDDPARRELVAAIRADMKRCLDAGPGLDAEACERLEALQGVPFGVFEILVRELGGGTDTQTGVFELPFTVAADGGKTTMAVYVPEAYDPARPWPLLVTMHGHGGQGRQMLQWYLPFARRHGFLVAAPQAHTKYANEGWASIEPERSNPVRALEAMKRRYRIDPDRVTLGGCCMGGHGTWEVGMLYADRFRALYPTMGGPKLMNFGYLHNLRTLPLFTYVGLDDQPYLVWNVREAVRMLEKEGAPVRCREVEGLGHATTPGEDEAFYEWEKDRVRDVYPEKISWTVNRLEHGRAWWLRIEAFDGEPFDPYRNKKVAVKPGATDDDLRRAYIASMQRKTPRVEARIEKGNRIVAKCRGVGRVTFFLSDRLLDLDRTVTVLVNGRRAWTGTPARSVAFLLGHAAETNDTGRVFAAAVTVDAK